ncbi:MFS transporter [uncultured Desulfobacter sp.]|uniref:MFS transporter n=1 Tax=uncultured Desulfobacter sp. TaxID=240139 RepID=UPI0029F51DF9|nr:MFS transporter [uncultured Desulfobacter sp.]
MTYLGGVYLLGVFWVLKFLWAPLVDRLGTCHDWILVTQSGMGNGIQAAGGLLGHLIGGGVVLLLYPSIGWQGCMSLLAICTAGSLVTVFLFKSAAVAIPSCNCSRGVTLRRRLRFWKTPGHGNWLVMLLLYPLGNCLGYSLMTPWLVDAGWSMDRVGMLMSIAGSLIGVPASLATGWLIRRAGRRSVMIGTCIAQLAGLGALLAPMGAWVHETGTCIAYGLFFISLSPVTVILSTLMMDYASRESPATDYALQFGLFWL